MFTMRVKLPVRVTPVPVEIDQKRVFNMVRAVVEVNGVELDVTSLLNPEDIWRAHNRLEKEKGDEV